MKKSISVLLVGAACMPAAFARETAPAGTESAAVSPAFTRVTGHPELGDARQEPNRPDGRPGVIWGDLVPITAQSRPYCKNMAGFCEVLSQNDARLYCASIGADLPTDHDFVRLRALLGYGSADGYRPNEEQVPHLRHRYFWSDTLSEVDPTFGYRLKAFQFDGGFGDLRMTDRLASGDLRCVLHPRFDDRRKREASHEN